MSRCNPPKPRVYRVPKETIEALRQYDYRSVDPYFPEHHPNTRWLLNRMRCGSPKPLVNILKTRSEVHLFFKYSYFQIRDCPSMYMSKSSLERPMFNKDAYLFLNVFAMAVYLRCDTMVQVLSQVQVKKLENAASYAALSDVTVPLYAAYVHDQSLGDYLSFSLPALMMRRECYFSVAPMLRFGGWQPEAEFSVTYCRRNYMSKRKFADWMSYAWELLCERPCTKINELVYELSSARHSNFYIGKRIFYQPISCRAFNDHDPSDRLAQRAVVVCRSYPRRLLCELFLRKSPERLLPQIISFIRVFYREKYFVTHSSKAMQEEFVLATRSSLESRFLAISPICNVTDISYRAYVSENGHRISMYDFDNIVALLLHFLVVVSDRDLQSLRNSLAELIMDILGDASLVYLFCKEPAVNISYYLSYLVDGPMVQPRELQTMLRSIPVLLINWTQPDKYFPNSVRVEVDEKDFGYELFTQRLPKLWERKRQNAALTELLQHRINVDQQVGVGTLRHCYWKNSFLMKRLERSLKSFGSQRDDRPLEMSERLNVDDDGNSLCVGWCAEPRSFFARAKSFVCCTQTSDTIKKPPGANRWEFWTNEMLEEPSHQ